MIDLDNWQEIVQTLGKNKLRTALTALGVFWGIFMLILMLGFGSSLELGVQKSMFGFASNAIHLWGRETSLPYQGLPPGRNIEFENADVDALRESVPDIDIVAPRLTLGGWRGGTTVVRQDKVGSFTISGDVPAYTEIQPMTLTAGRFINPLDIAERRKVAVIGSEVAKQMFSPGEKPVGQSVQIRGVYFQIVGVFSVLASGGMGDRMASTIHVPFSTFQQAFNAHNEVGFITFTARAGASAQTVESQAKAVLAERHQISPKDNNALGGWNTGAEFDKIQKLFGGINTTIWVVGVFTLLAGVIGVSNIMLIAVKERTKEIGVRKALGATPRAIVTMILQEALLLTAMAGYLGLVAGVGLLELVGGFIGDGIGEGGVGRRGGSGLAPVFAAPSVSIEAALLATLVLVLAGVLAGIIPARHAARIRPIEALRAE